MFVLLSIVLLKITNSFKFKLINFWARGIIISSKSSWHSQVVVTTKVDDQRRLLADYTFISNKYKVLDAFGTSFISDIFF